MVRISTGLRVPVRDRSPEALRAAVHPAALHRLRIQAAVTADLPAAVTAALPAEAIAALQAVTGAPLRVAAFQVAVPAVAEEGKTNQLNLI